MTNRYFLLIYCSKISIVVCIDVGLPEESKFPNKRGGPNRVPHLIASNVDADKFETEINSLPVASGDYLTSLS